MRRVLIGLVAVLGLVTVSLPALAQVPSDLVPTCIGRSGSITVTANLQTLPAALEVDLFVQNGASVPLRIDPSNVMLRTGEGVLTPWTVDQVKRAHRDLGAYMLAASIFPPLLAIAGVAQLNFNQYLNGRALRPGEIPPGQTLRGSIFFPLPAGSQFRAALELPGITPLSGEARPVRMYCPLPRSSSTQAPVGGFVPLTVSLSARGTSGPVEVVVETAEFAADYTAVELSIANKADIRAEIFGAMVNASMRDRGGNIYAGRPTRGDFGDQVPAKSAVTVRLVFMPLPQPPKTSAVSLILPAIRFGPEDMVDIVVELRF